MIKAILFDVDGVLIDITVAKAQRQLERDWGIKPAQTAYFFEHEFLECLENKKDLKEVLGGYLREWEWNDSTNAFLDWWFASQSDLNHDLLKEIEKIKKKHILCYVATNQEKYRTKYLINKLHFGKIFVDVFSSSQVGYMKHNPQFFQIILEKIHCKPNEILYWDDHRRYLQSAATIGIQTEWYTSFAQFQESMKKYL